MLCIGTYYSDDGAAMLYQMDYCSPMWVTNICYLVPNSSRFYSPSMANIVLKARDHDGRQRDSTYWGSFVQFTHDSYVLY
jgi:hypothetical protein